MIFQLDDLQGAPAGPRITRQAEIPSPPKPVPVVAASTHTRGRFAPAATRADPPARCERDDA